MGRLYIVGIGPGEKEKMTFEAYNAICESQVIAGYTKYIELVSSLCEGKEIIQTGMKQEKERCIKCIEKAMEGCNVALVCSGDAGIYGMASLVYEIAEGKGFDDIVVIPGITAASSGAAVLGAPINHDFCVISLSDLLTPFELIEKRLRAAAMGDFAMAIYNPSSHKRSDYLKRACDILLEEVSGDTACGYVKNIGRDGMEYKLCSLKELAGEEVDMFTTVFIGNSRTRIINNKLVTPRGYILE